MPPKNINDFFTTLGLTIDSTTKEINPNQQINDLILMSELNKIESDGINNRVWNLMQDAQRDFDFGPDSVYEAGGRKIQLPAIQSDSGEPYINKNPGMGQRSEDLLPMGHQPWMDYIQYEYERAGYEGGYPKSIKMKISSRSDDIEKVDSIEVPFDINELYVSVDNEGKVREEYLRYRQKDGSDVYIALDNNARHIIANPLRDVRKKRPPPEDEINFDRFHRDMEDDIGAFRVTLVKPDGTVSEFNGYDTDTRMFYDREQK